MQMIFCDNRLIFTELFDKVKYFVQTLYLTLYLTKY